MLKSDWIEGVHICEFKAIYLHVSIYKFIYGRVPLQYLQIADSWLQQVGPVTI